MESFAKNQEDMRKRVANAFGGGTQVFENMARQNLAMFERAMKMFLPFGVSDHGTEPERSQKTNGGPAKKSDEIGELKSEIEAMRKQLAELARERKSGT
jgi:polyhydroxyalkanoate synthesis regulator protein